MPMAVLKSMSDVVTRGLICGTDPRESEREREGLSNRGRENDGRRGKGGDKTKYTGLKVIDKGIEKGEQSAWMWRLSMCIWTYV